MCGFLSSYTSASAIHNTPSAIHLLTGLTPVSTTKTHKYDVRGLLFNFIKNQTINDDPVLTRTLTENSAASVSVETTINLAVTTAYATNKGHFLKLDWEGGDWVWRYRVVTAAGAGSGARITEIYLQRISNDSNTVKAEKTVLGLNISLETTGVKSGTITWNDGTQNPADRSEDDRILIRFRIDANSSTSFNRGHNLANNNDEINTPISSLRETTQVTRTRTHKFQVNYEIVTRTHTHKWNTIQKIYTPITKTHRWIGDPDLDASNYVPIRTPHDFTNYSIGYSSIEGEAQLYDRPISESAISVSESLTKVATYLRPISDTSISVSETLARVQTLIRTISDTSITVSEALARVPTYVKSINESTITVSDALARIQTLIRAINESSISVSEALVRLQTLIRVITDPSITVSDLIISGLSFTRPISESAITVNESLVRLPLYLRPINESTITVSDSILRWISVSYTLAEPTITVSETLVRNLIALRTISESAITTNETLTRLLAATRTISEGSITVNDFITRTQSIIRQISESTISVSDALQGSLLFTALLVESRIKWYYSVLTRKIGA